MEVRVPCPIDHEECEGANGRVGSPTCVSRCTAGQAFIEAVIPHLRTAKVRRFNQGLSVNRVGPKRGPEQHGVQWWAKKYKCECDPCKEARRKFAAERRVKYKNIGNNWRHGTTYAWDVKKCDCQVCLDHKVEFIRNKNRKVTERRRQERERAKAG